MVLSVMMPVKLGDELRPAAGVEPVRYFTTIVDPQLAQTFGGSRRKPDTPPVGSRNHHLARSGPRQIEPLGGGNLWSGDHVGCRRSASVMSLRTLASTSCRLLPSKIVAGTA